MLKFMNSMQIRDLKVRSTVTYFLFIDHRNKLKKTSPTVAELLKQQTQSTSLQNGSFSGGEANGGDSNMDDISLVSSTAKIDSAIESAINAAAAAAGASGDGESFGTPNMDVVPSLPSVMSGPLADTIGKIKQV